MCPISAYLCCTKCRYSTCCSRAMSLHIGLFHGPKSSRPEFDLGQPVTLSREVFCCCGFATKSGNKMGEPRDTFLPFDIMSSDIYPTRQNPRLVGTYLTYFKHN